MQSIGVFIERDSILVCSYKLRIDRYTQLLIMFCSFIWSHTLFKSAELPKCVPLAVDCRSNSFEF